MRCAQLVVIAAILVLASCGQAAEQTTPAPPSSSEPAQEDPSEAAIFCAEVARRVSASECATYEELAANASRGMAAFNTPNPMQRGETHVLQLAISAPAAAAPPRDAATSALPADDPASVVDPLPGATVEFEPLVGRFMRAELNGVGFDISPQSPAQQEVTPESVTTWSWQVVAREGGQRALTLTTVVEGCTENHSQCIPLRSTTTNYAIDVEVRPLDRARDFLVGVPEWVKIASGIIAALAGLIFALVSLRSAMRKARG